MNRDFLGVGRAQMLVSSPWGIAILGLGSGKLASSAIAENGTRLGSWMLDSAVNHIGPAGNFDGSASCSFLVTSGWGIGVLKCANGRLASTAMAAAGTRLHVASSLGGAAAFAVDVGQTQYGPVGNFEGTGRDVILTRGANAMATLRQSGSSFDVGLVVHDGALLGGAAVDHTCRFGPVGDYDGDGADEVLLVGASGLWVLKPRADRPACLTHVANGTSFFGWTLDTAQDQFGPAADLDGDGHAELLVTRAGAFALLKVTAAGFTVMALHKPGERIGGWSLGGADRIGPAADFNGDRRPELLISSGWGVGLLSWSGSGLQASGLVANGTACGGWRLNTHGDRMSVAADFDGDGHAELLVSSGWGVGLLSLGGAAPGSKATAPNGAALGNWRLDTAQNDLALGAARSDVLIGYHDAWKDVVADIRSVFTQRGTTVTALDHADGFISAMQTYAATCASGDRLFVYLGMHGNTQRAEGDRSKTPCETHGLQPNNGFLTLSQIAPSFRAIANRGVDLIVFDGSCEGGETVYDAFGERYCALSTTAPTDVALTGDPDPAAEAKGESKPATFGMWWTPPHLIGSRVNGRILLDMAQSARIQQRLYRNDNTVATQTMLFARPALASLYSLRSWWLDVSGCYLFPLLWPAQAASEKAADSSRTWPNGIDGVTKQAATWTSATRPALDDYQKLVLDAAYADGMAGLYAANFAAIWRCLADDPGWDVTGQPGKHAAAMGNVVPSAFVGAAGFTSLVNHAYAAVLTMRASYDRMAALVGAIDVAVRSSTALRGKAPTGAATPMKLERNSDDPIVAERLKQDSDALRKMRVQIGMASVEAIEPAAGRKPVTADLEPLLDARIHKWNAVALTGPTGDATVDNLAAQLMGTYSEYESSAFAGSFLLAIVEDVVCAHQSAGQFVPPDLNVF